MRRSNLILLSFSGGLAGVIFFIWLLGAFPAAAEPAAMPMLRDVPAESAGMDVGPLAELAIPVDVLSLRDVILGSAGQGTKAIYGEQGPELSTLALNVNYAHDWVAGTTDAWATVVVTVTDGASNLKADAVVTAEETGDFFVACDDWFSGECPDIQPGDRVIAYAVGLYGEISPIGEIPGELNAAENTVTAWLFADWLPNPTDVQCEVWEDPGPSLIAAQVDPNGGMFQCDFDDVGWDLEPFQQVAVRYYEPDGDSVISVLFWPRFIVNYTDDNAGANYYLNHSFQITVTDDLGYVKATGAADVQRGGGWGADGFSTEWWQWSPEQPDIVPGDFVAFAADDGYTHTMHVGQINGNLDVGADMITGTLLVPGESVSLTVECHPWGAWNAGMGWVSVKQSWAEPDGSSNWTCDWSGEWDIQPGQDVGVVTYETDGDLLIDVYREPAAYLRIEKWAEGEGTAGGNMPFRVQYWNEGDAPAENVIITDTLNGLSYLTDTAGLPPSGGGGQVVWDVGTVAAGDGAEFVMFAEVTAAVSDVITNSAQIATSSPDQGEPWEKESTWVGLVHPNDTHLNIGTWSWTGSPAPGNAFVLVANVCNGGGTSSAEVTITDTLHPLLSLQNWWSYDPAWSEVSSGPQQLVVSRPTLQGGCSEIYMRVLLDGGALPGDTVNNTAVVSSPNDMEPEDNESYWEGTVNEPHLNLNIGKWRNSGILVPGGTIEYGIGYNNNGNVPVGPFLITETLPVSTTFIEAWHNDPWGGYAFPPLIVGPDYVVWEIAELENGWGGDFWIRVAIDPGAVPGTILTNTVEAQPLPGEDNYDDNVAVQVELLNGPGPNLRVQKWHQWNGDGQLGYTIDFENVGDQTITNVWITDVLPLLTQWDGWWDLYWDWSRLVSADYVSGTRTFAWQFSEINPMERGTIQFNANLDEPGVPVRWFTNTVDMTIPPGDVVPGDNSFTDVAFSGGEVHRVEFWLNKDGSSSMWGEAVPGYPVTVTTPYTQLYAWADPDCGGCWNIDNAGTILPGEAVEVLAGPGLLPVNVTIPDPLTAELDADANQVYGQIGGWNERTVEVHGSFGYMETTSDAAGNYVATFAEIPANGNGYIRFVDNINYAEVIFHKPFWSMELVLDINYGHDWVEGSYEPGHTVWLTVTEEDGTTVKGLAELPTDYVPWWGGGSGFSTNWQGWLGEAPNLQAYDWVYGQMDNGYTNTVQLGEISYQVDFGADLFSGVVLAPWLIDPIKVQCEVWGSSLGEVVYVDIDPGGGPFVCDFGGAGYDLVPGYSYAVMYWHPDGERVINVLDWPNIVAQTGPDSADNQVWGSHAEPNGTVVVTVTDSLGIFVAGTSVQADEWGNFNTENSLPQGVLATWNEITVDFANGFSDTMTVYPLSAEANPDTDVITVTAGGEPTFGVHIDYCEPGWCDSIEMGELGVSGIVTVNLMVERGFDVRPNTSYNAHLHVENGHELLYAWSLTAPDAGVWKWHHGNYARPGGVVVYQLEYRNEGNGTAENTVIVDTLPMYTSYAGDTSGLWVTVGPGNVITWDVGLLDPGSDVYFLVTLNVDAGAPTGTATIAENCAAISTTTEGDWNPDNDSTCSGPVDVWEDDVEVAIDKWANPGDPSPGQEFAYTVQWCNNRGAATGPAALTETFPIETTLLGWWNDSSQYNTFSEVSFAGNELVLYAPGLPGDTCENIHFQMLLDPGTPLGTTLVNLVEIAIADDVNPDNNWLLHNWAYASSPRYDLWLGKSYNGGVLVPGGEVNFSIDWQNNSNVTTTAQLTDTLTPGLGYVEGYWAGYTPWGNEPIPDPIIAGNDLIWNMPEMAINEGQGINVRLAIDAGVPPGTELGNCATIAPDGPDENDDNLDCESIVVNPAGPNLRVTKWHNWNGDGQLGYTVRFENIGTEPIYDVWVTDTLPLLTQWDGWWDMNFDWSRLLYSEYLSMTNTLVWQFSELYPGEGGEIWFNANLDEPGTPMRWYTNTAEITMPAGDTVPEDNVSEDVAFSGGEVWSVDVEVSQSHIWGYAPSGPVTITTQHEQVIMPWDGDFDWWFDQPFLPGDVFTVSAASGTQPVVITIPDPFAATAESSTGEVTGQVDNLDGEWVQIELSDGTLMSAQTNSSGHFSATFPNIPRDGSGEVRFMTHVDYTEVVFHRWFRTMDLILNVNASDMWIEGSYEAGHTVWITITESDGVTIKGTRVLTTGIIPWWGSEGFSTNYPDWPGERPIMVPGDWVFGRVDNGYTSTVQIGAIEGEMDIFADTLAGTVEAPWPGEVLQGECFSWDEGNNITFDVAADGGAYFCDFGANGYDLQSHHYLGVQYREPDGDRVYASFQWPWARVNYGHDWVGANYAAFHTFWITVTNEFGAVKGTAEVQSWMGGGWGNLNGFDTDWSSWNGDQPDIVPGDFVIFVSDNGYSNTIEVGLIDGTLDVNTDSVSGPIVAPWLMPEVAVQCHPWGAWNIGLDVQVKESSAVPDGSVPFNCSWDPLTEWDIVPGQDVAVMYLEPDHDTVIDVYREPAPYLRISKWSRGEAAAGGNVSYGIEIRNDGDAPAENVLVIDDLEGMVYIGDTNPYTVTGGGSHVEWEVGTLEAGQWARFRVFAEVTAPVSATITNTVWITTSSPYDQGSPDEKVSWASGLVWENDTHLNLGKWSWTGDPAAGQVIIFTINTCNNGGTSSSEVTLTDDLHPALTLLEWWTDDYNWYEVYSDTHQLIMANPSVPNNSCSEITLRVNVDGSLLPGELISNTATIAAANDLEPDDNTAYWEGYVAEPHVNIGVDKWLNWATLVPGGELNYGMRYYNDGNVPVGPFLITETLPAGTYLIEAWHNWPWEGPFVPVATGPDYLVWEIPGLENGWSYDFWVHLGILPDVTPGSILTNSIEATQLPGEDRYDDNMSTWVEAVNPFGPNLRVAKFHEWWDEGHLGYHVRFENVGTEPIYDVVVSDMLPPGMTWDGWWNMDWMWERLMSSPSDPSLLQWHFSELNPGETDWLHFGAWLDEPGIPNVVYTNTVEITVPPGELTPEDNVAVDAYVTPALPTALWIVPEDATIPLSGTMAIDIVVTDVYSLYGIALEITFDPTVVEVVDADPGEPGVQITAGTCPQPSMVLANSADNATGVIHYDAFSLAPTPACTGSGLVATVEFRGLTVGDSAVHFNSWLLADFYGEPIQSDAHDGVIMVRNLGTITGTVLLQGRTDHSGVDVCAYQSGVPMYCAQSDATGYYELAGVNPGFYDIIVEMDRYLDAEKLGVEVVGSETTALSLVTLLGGDANNDCTINILDLALMGGRYLLSCGDPGWDSRADINNDCTVNILDIVLAGGNYLQSCPVPWP